MVKRIFGRSAAFAAEERANKDIRRRMKCFIGK
jgi:hypothetical protein